MKYSIIPALLIKIGFTNTKNILIAPRGELKKVSLSIKYTKKRFFIKAAKFFKIEVYEKHGLFDLSYRISADYDFLLRVFRDSDLKFRCLPKVITKMRVGGASNRSIKNIFRKSKEDYSAIRRNNIGNFLTLINKNTSKLKQFF